jgi:hypothetical protein
MEQQVSASATAEGIAVRGRAWWRARGVWWALHAIEFALISGALLATQLLAAKLWLLPNGDVDEYQQYAIAFWTRQPVGHALPVEYPPLAIVPFTLTIVPPGINPHITFGIWMGLFVLAGYYALVRLCGRARALTYLGYLLLSCAATLLARFDIVPALVTLVALWAAGRRRFGSAYTLLALGVLLKLYPIFLLPVVLIAHWRALSGDGAALAIPADWWRGRYRQTARHFWRQPPTRAVVRGALLCLGLVAAGFVGALLLNPSEALTNLLYAGQRPLQAESTPASLLWLSTIFGLQARPDYSFTSLNYVGQLDGALRLLSTVALAAGCLWVYWRQARQKLTLEGAFLACICVVLATNKIFSPQYLIWAVPLVAYVVGLDWIWVAICFLTWLDFPIMYQWEHPIWRVPFSPLFMPALALRNVLLLWVTLRAIIRPRPAALPALLPRRARDGAAKRPEEGHTDAEPALAH